MPDDLVISCFMAVSRALFISTLLMLISPAWYFAITKVISGKCSARTFSALFLTIMILVMVTYLIVSLPLIPIYLHLMMMRRHYS